MIYDITKDEYNWFRKNELDKIIFAPESIDEHYRDKHYVEILNDELIRIVVGGNEVNIRKDTFNNLIKAITLAQKIMITY